MSGPAGGFRLPEALIDEWLARHGIARESIEKRAPVWQTARGMGPLSFEDVERLISVEDPVAWAWLNLIERRTLTIDGEVAVIAGSPWCLFPIQAQLARTHGDLIVECGSEVGKTRDIVLRRLWRADTNPTGTSMIGGDSDQTLIPIWEELEFQIESNPRIGGGLVEEKCHIKPNRKKVFRNGSEIELRLAGFDGKNFRGGHFSDGIDADEAVKWKNRQQWGEYFRAALPGAIVRAYSTPDGDYSSYFYAMCARAILVNGPEALEAKEKNLAPAVDGERRFKKFHISKRDLPAPFWSEARAATFREQFGGEHTVEWITNVEGGWGSPSYSVFPTERLRPCLKNLETYRFVRASIDREHETVALAASRLNPSLEVAEGVASSEEMLERETYPMSPDAEGARDLGRRIAAHFPETKDWLAPRLYCGGDLGSAQDPTELVFNRVVGKKWIDVFRLYLRSASPTEQAEIVMELDHASGHRVIYSLDNGSWGSALIEILTKTEAHRQCPECRAPVYLEERLSGRGFGEKVDQIDIETGEPALNPDDEDAAGNQRPYRISNKEFGTRILELKVARVELEIALDGGAGDQRLSGPQLMVNHTASGTNKKGERNFRGTDDHHVDARRQLALAIVSEVRSDGFVAPARADLVASGAGRVQVFDGGMGSIGEAFGGGNVGAGLRGDR